MTRRHRHTLYELRDVCDTSAKLPLVLYCYLIVDVYHNKVESSRGDKAYDKAQKVACCG